MKTTGTLFLLAGLYSGVQAQTYIAYAKDLTQLTDSNHAVIAHVEKGDAMLVNTTHAHNGHHRVHLLRQKKEGFIGAHQVHLERKVADEQGNVSSVFNTEELRNPMVKIHNSSAHQLVMKMGKDEYIVPAHERMTVQLPKGKHYYKVTMSDIDPHYASEVLEEYRIYEWEFYVDTDM